MSIIRFEQAVFKNENQDKAEIYKNRFQEIARVFTKNTLLQMLAFPTWEKCLDLSTPWANDDYSKYLFEKTDELFKEFEELQLSDKLEQMKEVIGKAISKINESNKQ